MQVLYYLEKAPCVFTSFFLLWWNFLQFNPIQSGRSKKIPHQFFLCNFYKRKNEPQNLSDFKFRSFYYTGVKLQGHTYRHPQIIELEPRAPLKLSFSSVSSRKRPILNRANISSYTNFEHQW